MEEFYRCVTKNYGDQVVVDLRKITARFKTRFDEHFLIKFVFGYVSDISFQFLKHNSRIPRIVTRACLPLEKNSVTFDADGFSDAEEVRRVIRQKLEELEFITPSVRREMMTRAARMPLEAIIKSMPEDHNAVVIYLCAFVSFKFDRRWVFLFDKDDKMFEKAFEKYTRCGVDSDACSICLEDFSDGSEDLCSSSDDKLFDECNLKVFSFVRYWDDSIFMPCGHRFHVDCIDKWLGFGAGTHGCPICRGSVLALVLMVALFVVANTLLRSSHSCSIV